MFALRCTTLFEPHLDPHAKKARCLYGAIVAKRTKAGIGRPAKLRWEYLRRLLGLNPRSSNIPLCTETGLRPVLHRRVEATLNYLFYLVKERLALPWVDLLEAQETATEGNGSWLKDLHKYLGKIAPELNFVLGDSLTATVTTKFKCLFVKNLQASLKELVVDSEPIALIKAHFCRDILDASASHSCRH